MSVTNIIKGVSREIEEESYPNVSYWYSPANPMEPYILLPVYGFQNSYVAISVLTGVHWRAPTSNMEAVKGLKRFIGEFTIKTGR